MKQTYTLFLLFILLLTACNEPDDYSPVLRGTISGKVLAYNEYNEPLSPEKITIKVLGEDFSLEGNTDANGNYTIEKVPHGEWKYAISKPGFKTHYKNDFNFFEEKATLDFQISRAPTFYVDLADFYVQDGNTIKADILLSEAVPAGKEFTLVTYLHNTSAVSSEKYLHKSIAGFTSTSDKNLQLEQTITVEGLKNRFGFKAGDKVYFRIYPGAARLYGYWEGDEYRVEAGVNMSLAVDFTLTLP